MKILIHSNSPRSATGYGVQTALLAARLVDDGHEVAVSCNHGQQTGMGAWTTPSGKTVRLYPTSDKEVGAGDIVHGHAIHFFEGDPEAGWILTLIDVPCIAHNPHLKDFNVIAWTPVDHQLVPPGVVGFFRNTDAEAVAMSQHGQRELARAGIEADFVPLAVDTSVFKPTPFQEIAGCTVTSRELFGLPRDAFVVGMVAMNKGNAFDRKGFSEALYAFGEFHRRHPNAVLFLHTDMVGFTGLNLRTVALYAGIPAEAIVFSDQYAYVMGFPPSMMAGVYTSMDVLLSPSHGEGFCVPLIEAQACGTPVIASRATSQTELVCEDAGWFVSGQPVYDPGFDSPAFMPFISSIVDALESAYAADLVELQAPCREWAQRFDADQVFDEFWRPYLATLDGAPADDKSPMERVAVIVPGKRPQQWPDLIESFETANDGTAHLYLVVDDDDAVDEAALRFRLATGNSIPDCVTVFVSERGETFAQKGNDGYHRTDEDWLFVPGEDCRFTPGWLDAPRELSTRFDVIGTNDAADGEVKNPNVAAGRHADHWFTRRAYIDEHGACLEGPGEFLPEAYYHWWVDREVIELARARGVFTPCLDSHVIHLHPGYDGDEEARANDPVYMKAVEWSERDQTTFMRRAPLIEQHRVTRKRGSVHPSYGQAS